MIRLNEQQIMLKKSARDLLANECPSSLVRKLAEEEGGWPEQAWSKMAELGWLGLIVPEEHCGCAGSFFDLVVLAEEMGRACLPGPFMSSSVVGAMFILEMGNEKQKMEYLTKIADGSLIIAPAILEPKCDWRLDKISVKAVKTGDSYVISGTKTLVPYAHIANVIICLAATSSGPAIFLIDKKLDGVKTTSLKNMDGDKLFEINFNKVKVSAKDMLGKPDKNLVHVKNVLSKAAVVKCAEMVGGGQQVLDFTVDYVKERKQFGSPVGAFQAVQHHCANMFTDVETSRLLTYEAAAKISNGEIFALEAAMAKSWVNEAYTRITYTSHQCVGGVGFMADHDLPLYTRRAKTSEYLFGDSVMQRENVAKLLKL